MLYASDRHFVLRTKYPPLESALAHSSPGNGFLFYSNVEVSYDANSRRFDSSAGTMKQNRQELIETWKKRPVSWSQLYSWQYSKDQWANKYIFGIDDGGNNLMRFGNVVGDTLGTPKSMCPLLNPSLVGVKEFELTAKLNGLTLTGFADHYCPDTKVLNENKTSVNLNRWDQDKVDNHHQLTMYALMLMLTNKTKPEDVEMWLNFIPVKETQNFEMDLVSPDLFHRFPTRRTTKQCLEFGASINKTLKAMELYANTVDSPA